MAKKKTAKKKSTKKIAKSVTKKKAAKKKTAKKSEQLMKVARRCNDRFKVASARVITGLLQGLYRGFGSVMKDY